MSRVQTPRADSTTTRRAQAAAPKGAASIRCKSSPKHARSEHLTTRTEARPAAQGVTMDYQQGFTSGPSM